MKNVVIFCVMLLSGTPSLGYGMRDIPKTDTSLTKAYKNQEPKFPPGVDATWQKVPVSHEIIERAMPKQVPSWSPFTVPSQYWVPAQKQDNLLHRVLRRIFIVPDPTFLWRLK